MTFLMFLCSMMILIVGSVIFVVLTATVKPEKKKVAVLVLTIAALVGQWTWYSQVYHSEARQQTRQLERRVEREIADAAYAESECRSTTGAFVMSQGFVKRSLKAPATASFPNSAVSSTVTAKCQFVVVAYVDSQNSFGANIRTSYVAKIEYLPSSREWRLLSLTM